jgi:hypothetical protein
VERRYEIETLRRSLAMLTPGAPATVLSREEALRVLAELQDVEAWLHALRNGLRKPVDEAELRRGAPIA